jgi:hypothetical protein
MATKTKDHTNLAAVAPLTPAMIQHLEMVVPRTELLETLARLQIPFPARLPDIKEDDAFPTDITSVQPRELRALQSFWAAQFARTNALLGICRGERKAQERKLDRAKKRLFRIYAPERSSKIYVDAIHGKVAASRRITDMEIELDNLIRMEEALDALTKDFNMYVTALDRESMWRMAEMRISTRTPT